MLVPLIYRQTSHRKAKTRAGVRLGFIRRDGKRLGARWLIVDSEDIPLDDAEPGEAFITRLVQKGLCPPSGDRWNVRIQKLPVGADIPQQHKNRLITDSSVTAALGGVMISHHGAN